MDFLKSFIFPLKMRRFRNMSILFAILIFIMATYLAIVPVKYKHSKPLNVIKTNAYLTKDFYDATTDFDYTAIKNKNYAIKDSSELVADDTTSSSYTINGIVNNTNYKFYIVFDFDIEAFSATDDLYEIYGFEKEEASCVLLFAKGYYELQNTKEETVNEVKRLTYNTIQGSTYRDANLDFAAYNDTNEFMDAIAMMLAKLYGAVYVSMFTLTCAFMVILLPLVLILVLWLVLRKKGSITKFKEYYNIAGIACIIPTLIAFGVAWFWPQIINFYTTAFVVYYLFVIYRINAFPIDYEEKKPIKPATKPQAEKQVEEVEVVEENTTQE